MKHHDAVRLSLVEKYLLDELPAELRDEFEEHYFDCQDCTIDLRATAAFLDTAKEQLKTFPAAKPVLVPATRVPATRVPAKKTRTAWFWSPAFAFSALAACLMFIAYQNFLVYPHYRGEIAQLQAPQILPSITLAGGESRGGEMQSINVRRKQPFSMLVDIPVQDRFTSYTCLLYSPTGTLVAQIAVSAQQAKDTVVVSVPAADWAQGTYSLTVQGNEGQAAGVDLEHQRFLLNSQE
jgi:hypothetical protein